MPFAPNPPLADAAAPYHIDLLSLIAGLRHGPAGYFYDIRTLLQASRGRVPFIGGPQAKSYLDSAVMTREATDAVALNPLFAKLDLKPTRLYHLVGERLFYWIGAQPEESLTEPHTPAFKISGSTFCTSLVALLANHIWTYQTVEVMQAREEDERQRKLLPDRYAGSVVPFSIVRSHSPTLAAYSARAYVKAGYRRHNSRNREELYARVNERLQENEWTVRASSLHAREDRKTLIVRTGRFSPQSADELLAGRILGITEEEFVRNDLLGLLFEGMSKQPRSYYTDRQYLYLDPLLYDIPAAANGVLLADSCYGTTFSPAARALYGEGLPTQGIGGAPIEKALSGFRLTGHTRAAVHRIPIIEARSIGELGQAVNAIARVAAGPLLFRGQTRHFKINRPDLANEILYGDPNVDELSLLNASSRARFDWDHFQYRFQLQLQGLRYIDLPAQRFDTRAMDPEGTLRFDDVEVQRRYDEWDRNFLQFEQASMGIAQHYGIPTDGLDLTSDLTIALWFAISKYVAGMSNGGEPTAWYSPLEPGTERPVIYVICAGLSVNSVRPLASLGGLRSPRAERQSAHLHYGGWGMHMNLCATETIAAIFLSPACVAQAQERRLSVEHLFPDENEDRLYSDLLALRTTTAKVGQPWGFDRIVRYMRAG